MTLQELTVVLSCVLAYNTLIKIEQYQNSLKIINGEIAKRNTPMSEETTPVSEAVVEEETVEATPEVE